MFSASKSITASLCPAVAFAHDETLVPDVPPVPDVACAIPYGLRFIASFADWLTIILSFGTNSPFKTDSSFKLSSPEL